MQILLHHTCTYNRLPEDEPPRFKHIENNINIKILVYKRCILFVCIVQLCYNAWCKQHEIQHFVLLLCRVCWFIPSAKWEIFWKKQWQVLSVFSKIFTYFFVNINPLTPNDDCSGRTAPLTSKRCILYIYSTNIGTEYFKHGIDSPFFPLQNAVCFINLTFLVPVLFTFYIQVC